MERFYTTSMYNDSSNNITVEGNYSSTSTCGVVGRGRNQEKEAVIITN